MTPFIILARKYLRIEGNPMNEEKDIVGWEELERAVRRNQEVRAA